MIDVTPWMDDATNRLKQAFGPRLLVVGLQGSHRHGEAREDSDIDILAVLDTLDMDDLTTYRDILRTLPEGEKAHGFVCGREELQAWPKHELFQFLQDTHVQHGDLQALLPAHDVEDIRESVRIAAANLYHATAHTYMAAIGAPADELPPLYKAVFFVMQIVYYLRHGEYVHTRSELLTRLDGEERDLLALSLDARLFDDAKRNDPAGLFRKLLGWTGKTLRESR